MDIGDGASLDLVDILCYPSDMLIVDGDADAAVEYVWNGISFLRKDENDWVKNAWIMKWKV